SRARGRLPRLCGPRGTARPRLVEASGAGARPGHGYDRPSMSAAADVATLARNAVHLLPERGLEEKLRLERPLRVKLGIDVTSPDIHIGRAIPLQRMLAVQH